ncbi:G2/M phase-specific E3 ubiquitin-protein ligase-like isoform X2 [Salvelinus alpinus]|uniref:G2/M phase-specific E3 ubiquitin-protein ligase-like isoform X2 n=1 Tax=Salvelinus alpinus TaxID=8036 RepID=UPI0039FCAE75
MRFNTKTLIQGLRWTLPLWMLSPRWRGQLTNGVPPGSMRDIRESAIFEGPEGAKRMPLDVHASHEGLYGTIGEMISVCVVLGGVGPHFFSERLFPAVCGKPVPPLSLEEIKKSEDLSEVKNKLEELVDWLSLLGLKRIVVKTMEDRDGVIELVAQQFVQGSMQVALEQYVNSVINL